MGAALASAAVKAGHSVCLVLGPVDVAYPSGVRRIDVETASEMFRAVVREFPSHDLLIMAAAVADYRPVSVSAVKLSREGKMTLELESTEDIVAAAGNMKRPGPADGGIQFGDFAGFESGGRQVTAKEAGFDCL